jgi:hypothetical protein
MTIQHLPQDNASHDILPYRAGSLQSSSTARDPNTTSNHDDNQDVNEENPDTDSQVSDRYSSHGNNSLEEEEEKEGAEGDEQEVGEGEDDEEDENDDRDDDEHGKEPQTRLNSAIRKKETIISMQRKENEHKMTSKGQKAISSAEPSSARKSKNELKRTTSGQRLINSPSKRPKTRVLTLTTDTASLKRLEHIPKSSIYPAEVYKIFLDPSQSKDLNGM